MRKLALPLVILLLATTANFGLATSLRADEISNNSSISPEEKKNIGKLHGVIDEMMDLYATEALVRPPNLATCVTEMMAMSASGECRDRFSYYLPPEEAQKISEELSGAGFGGVGIKLTIRDGKITVVAPIADMPAEKAGIKSGDIIIGVDGREPKNLKEVAGRIRGQVGSKVKITVMREKVLKPIEIEITRIQIVVHSVKAKIIPGDKPVGYVSVSEFIKPTAEEFKQDLKNFFDQNLPVVIDLRNNPGGLLDSALEMLALFMKPDDILLTVKDRSSEKKYDAAYLSSFMFMLREAMDLGSVERGIFQNKKVVILVNEGSASASEIFAGTMKDWGYMVVGECSEPNVCHTFGKGVGQEVFSLSDGSKFALTTFEFLVGNRKVQIRDKGVTPNVEVKSSLDPNDKTDYPLLKALEILRGM